MESMPLEGLRILDLTSYLVGAGATVMLADLGADVIKIEQPPTGDPMRSISLPDPDARTNLNYLVENANRNKRSIALNLKNEADMEVLQRLVAGADVVAESFRPGVAERLGIDYESMRRHNPQIIVASVNGFGSSGPDANRPSFDIIGHARSGLMELLTPEGDMRYVGPVTISDQTTAIAFCLTILAALASRSIHGTGQHVEVSMLSAALMLQAQPLHKFLFSGEEYRKSNSWPGERTACRTPLFNVYPTADRRWIALGCQPAQRYWPTVCAALDREDLAEDPRFADDRSRAANSRELITILDDVFATRTQSEWVDRLKATDVVFSPVQNHEDLLDDPQVAANELIQEVEHPDGGTVKVLAPPMKFSSTKPRYRWAAPTIGQHTDEILSEAGYSGEGLTTIKQRLAGSRNA